MAMIKPSKHVPLHLLLKINTHCIASYNFQLWNASQLEMVHLGKMHGFMRQVTFY